MKKFTATLFATIICIMAIFTFVACDNKDNSQPIPNNWLQMDTEYNLFNIEEGRISRYTFHSDGTGEYRRYYIPDNPKYSSYDYTYYFVYEYINQERSEITLFPSQIKFHDTYNDYSTFPSNVVFKVSKDIILYTTVSGFSGSYGGSTSTTTTKYVTTKFQEKYNKINNELKEQLQEENN